MYIIEYLQILSAGPLLWVISAVVAVLFFVCMKMLEEMAFQWVGIPLLVGAVAATFLPTDTFICIDRDTLSGHCNSELGTGIIILFAISYCIAATVYYVQLKMKQTDGFGE